MTSIKIFQHINSFLVSFSPPLVNLSVYLFASTQAEQLPPPNPLVHEQASFKMYLFYDSEPKLGTSKRIR